MMRWVGLAAVVGVLGATSGLSMTQDNGLQEEMERWRQAHKRHLARLLELLFDEKTRGAPIPHDVLTKYPEDTLDVLEPYHKHESPEVRSSANGYARRVALETYVGSPIREEVVARLVNACLDPDAGVWQHAAKWLLDFHEADFTSDAVVMLGNGVIREPVRDDVILVVGVAKLSVLDTWLKRISEEHFNAVLALARLGDDEAARQAVERVDKMEDVRLRVADGLYKLAYTCHPIALRYIVTYLDREEGEVTLAEGGDYGSRAYKHDALAAIAKYFPGCPVKFEYPRHYSDAELGQVREWVKKQLEEHEQ